MRKELFLQNETARLLYKSVKELPIYDYHCHLDPKEIAEDRIFKNIGDLWLGHDHYKWRLMRAAGKCESLITGDACDRDKFQAYAETIALAAGNPLYIWTHMELSEYFGIDERLHAGSAERIWNGANEAIQTNKLSPRKMIEHAHVRYIATTDDPADSLAYHERIAKDESFACTVAPSFRTDRALNIKAAGYSDYVRALSEAADIDICSLADLKDALAKRLFYFKERGCRFSDLGIPAFPAHAANDAEAGAVFEKALRGCEITESEFEGFLGNMDVFLAGEYRRSGIIMQWHTSVLRNVNTRLYAEAGADSGGDCINDRLSVTRILQMLDRINSEEKLPETILYALNPSMLAALCAACGSFRHVKCGAAWWFCDHKRGIRDVLETIAETGYIASFPGMLTDSRSFTSYVRHDYFRRIVCGMLGEWVEAGELDEEAAYITARKLSHDNAKDLINGITFCTGSLGAAYLNGLFDAADKEACI